LRDSFGQTETPRQPSRHATETSGSASHQRSNGMRYIRTARGDRCHALSRLGNHVTPHNTHTFSCGAQAVPCCTRVCVRYLDHGPPRARNTWMHTYCRAAMSGTPASAWHDLPTTTSAQLVYCVTCASATQIGMHHCRSCTPMYSIATIRRYLASVRLPSTAYRHVSSQKRASICVLVSAVPYAKGAKKAKQPAKA